MGKNDILYSVLVFCIRIGLIENICEDSKSLVCPLPEYANSDYCPRGLQLDKQDIKCTNISISDIISYNDDYYDDVSESYTCTLQVDDSEIPTLPTSVFKTLRRVSELDLEDIQLENIMPGAFNFLDNLKILNLKRNKLKIISDGIFNSLIALEKLDLSGNYIADISHHAFAGVFLNYVNLRNNSISHLSDAVLASFTHLLYLDLAHNNFSEITYFSNLSVRTVDMSFNNIHTLDFAFLHTISESIDFTSNNISKILNFNISTATKISLGNNMIVNLQKNDYVNHLNVSYNRIGTIEGNVLGNQLQLLDASHNLISSINSSAFFGLFDLGSLLLNNNNLSSIPIGCFKDLHSLYNLNLSGNKIPSFSFGTFDKLINLTELDISENNLQSLNTFHSMRNLREFSIRNNEISDINIEDLILHMQKLTVMKLDGNRWRCAKLVYIIYTLGQRNILIPKGNCSEESNVDGIKCYDISEKTDETQTQPITHETLKSDVNSEHALGFGKLVSFFNEDFTKSIMYKYFNKDFKDSNFFKYLENLNNVVVNNSHAEMLYAEMQSTLVKLIRDSKTNSNFNFNETVMDNYFNRDFTNSSFYKYLEGLRDQRAEKNNSKKLADNQEKIVEILENISKTNSNFQKDDFNKSGIYNYFNTDFKNSSFFKYLESLGERDATPSHPEHLNDSQMERLISNFGKEKNINSYPSYTGMLSFISVLIILNVCIMIIGPYFYIMFLKKYNFIKPDQVELI